MTHRYKGHKSIKPSEEKKDPAFFQTSHQDAVDNYEKEADTRPKDIQRLATPKEDEEPGASGTNEERMKNDKNFQE